MSVSKISRSLIVAIFTALIILICINGVYQNYSNISNSFDMSRIVYAIMLIVFSALYAIIKEKFSKKRIKKKISLTYRYIYLIVISFFVKIVSIMINIPDISVIYIITCSLIGTLSSVFIKRIIYNVSKSDMLSVLGMFMFAFLPNITYNKLEYVRSISMVAIILLTIMILQRLIDELKQPNLKTMKYIKLSIIIGALVGLSILTGVFSVIFIISFIILLFITENLDKTNVNFPNKVTNKLRQKNKEALYRLERIYINKKYISVLIIILTATVIFFLCGGLLKLINNDSLNNIFINNSSKDLVINIDKSMNNIDICLNSVKLGINNIVSNSKMYYTILAIYIIVLEILTIVLHRRYDTKSTMLKAMFILFTLCGSIFMYNISLYYLIYTSLFILIAITNTSNIYLNRDERIKLLNA